MNIGEARKIFSEPNRYPLAARLEAQVKIMQHGQMYGEIAMLSDCHKAIANISEALIVLLNIPKGDLKQ